MRERGVLIAQGTPLGASGEHIDQIQISPPVVIADEELVHGVDTLDDVLRSV